ncbi:hypothetical protein B0O80DRAFT_501334 [Mortierella sp. GBAus27b]|nr:hypothetical protein BGX31_009269 [Mortierella sp. GBA43]KAI8349617.1 hypothetical protein B0O80DRAFT_501334 [Mortierella sp. GBAus27b]
MVATQSFRLAGTTQTVDVPCDTVDGENIIFWEEIQYVLPGAQVIMNDNVAVQMMRDSNHKRMKPPRIKHHPGVVLDVIPILNPAISHTVPSFIGSRLSRVDSSFTVLPCGAIDDERQDTAPFTTSTASQIRTGALSSSTMSDSSHELGSTFIRTRTQSPLLTRNDRDESGHTLTGQERNPDRLSELYLACCQELKDEMIKNAELTIRMAELQDELKRLQPNSSSYSAQLKKQVQAMMSQTYEQHEDPIPRLFIVIPKDNSLWNQSKPFDNKFRLYFLCECGEHSKSTKSKILHHIHVANHKGYDLARPAEFFQLYGHHVLATLRMLKHRISVRGYTIPSLYVMVKDIVNNTEASLDELVATVDQGMDHIIGLVEKTLDEAKGVPRITEKASNSGTIGASELRKLNSFLRIMNEETVLGGLYKCFTPEGHAKWICQGHFHDNYKIPNHDFGMLLTPMKGHIEETTGRIRVLKLQEKHLETLCSVLEKARSVSTLRITFSWDPTYNDLIELRNSLVKTNIGDLQLCFKVMDGTANDIVNSARLYDPIIDIMHHPSIKTLSLNSAPTYLFTKSNLLSHNVDFANLRQLEIDPQSMDQAVLGLKYLISRTPNLNRLLLHMDSEMIPSMYGEIVDIQRCPIVFKKQSMRILPPTRDTQYVLADLKNEEDLFRRHGGQIEELDGGANWPNENAWTAFAKEAQSGLKLKEFKLNRLASLSGSCFENVATIVSRAELYKFEMQLNQSGSYARILESMQWKHLRELTIDLDPSSQQLSSVTRSLAVVAEKVTAGEKLGLEHFKIFSEEKRRDMNDSEKRSLKSFLSVTALRYLYLNLGLDSNSVVDLLKDIDMSRLQHLTVATPKIDPINLQAALDIIEHASDLCSVDLLDADMSDQQEERLHSKGIKVQT